MIQRPNPRPRRDVIEKGGKQPPKPPPSPTNQAKPHSPPPPPKPPPSPTNLDPVGMVVTSLRLDCFGFTFRIQKEGRAVE